MTTRMNRLIGGLAAATVMLTAALVLAQERTRSTDSPAAHDLERMGRRRCHP